jgi:hypothetical protein
MAWNLGRSIGQNDLLRPCILFICIVNRMRSATAHKLYETDSYLR